jgi:hypothetical protein
MGVLEMTLSSLNSLSHDKFENYAVNLIKNYEGEGTIFYVHPPKDPHPTIGRGFNIDAFDYATINKALSWVLGGLTPEQEKGMALIKIYKAGGKIDVDGTKVTLDYMMFKRIVEGTGGTAAQQEALQSISLTGKQQDELLKETLFGDAGIIDKKYDDGLTDALGAGGASIADSVERAALLSLYYNANTLIGNGIKWALNNDMRGALWYEIRYNHKFENEGRRIDESSRVGIVAANHSIDDIAKSLGYLFDGTDRSGKDVYETIIHRDHDWVIKSAQQFTQEASPLLAEVAKEYSHAYKLNMLLNGTEKSDTLDAKDALKVGGGSVANSSNALFGQGGDDTLNGQGGNDLLIGGRGNDDMTGGKGNDTYCVDSERDTISEAKAGGKDTMLLQAAGDFDVKNVEKLVLKNQVNGDIRLQLNDFDRITLSNKSDTIHIDINVIQPSPIAVKTGAGNDTIFIAPVKGVDPSQVSNGVGHTETFNFTDFAAGDRIDLTAFHIREIVQGTVQKSQESGYYVMQPGAEIDMTSATPKWSSYQNNTDDWWIAKLGNDTPWGPDMHGSLSVDSFVI